MVALINMQILFQKSSGRKFVISADCLLKAEGWSLTELHRICTTLYRRHAVLYKFYPDVIF